MKKYITTNNLLIVIVILSFINIFMTNHIFDNQVNRSDLHDIKVKLKNIKKEIIKLDKKVCS